MGTAPPAGAQSRDYRNHHLDSTRWDKVDLRDGDIVITTPYKTGTTWTQRIVGALVHGAETPYDRTWSPWVDCRFTGPVEPVVELLEGQAHRRFMKSHLALDGLRWHDGVHYVVVGRDPRDVFMSLLNHYRSYRDVVYERFADGNPGADFPRYDGDERALWREWIGRGWFDWERDGWPFWSAFHHLESWWTARDRPNVVLVHYADLLADPVAEIHRLASELGFDVDDEEIARVVEVSSFDSMRQEMLAIEAENGGPENSSFEGGAATFMYKGTNGRWRDLLTDEDLGLYEQRAAALDPALRTWLECGRHAVASTVP